MTMTRFLAATAIVGMLATPALAGTFSVDAGKTEPLRLSGGAGSVVVGDPDIADVSVHTDRLLFISGKIAGTTNLMVFDKDGRLLYSADLVVAPSNENTVTISRAGIDLTYDCTPNCRARDVRR